MTRKITDWAGQIVAFMLVILVNAMANSVPIGGQTTGEVSAKYPTLFTPAAFTFSIWGAIYLALLGYVVYQAIPARRTDPTLHAISWLFVVSCLSNVAWLLAWHYDLLWLSVLLMAVLLTTLIRIYSIINSTTQSISIPRRIFLHVPFSLYTAWIVVALIANISAVQFEMGWQNLAASEENWTLFKLAVAGTVGATMILLRADLVFVLVITWAAFGIAVKQAATPSVAGAATMLVYLGVLLAGLAIIARAGRVLRAKK